MSAFDASVRADAAPAPPTVTAATASTATSEMMRFIAVSSLFSRID
jgi:hypothetical protein